MFVQNWSFYIWTLVHLAVAAVVAFTAPALTALIVVIVLICSQISVYFNARLDEGIFDETSDGPGTNLMRSAYMLGPFAILALTGTLVFFLVRPI